MNRLTPFREGSEQSVQQTVNNLIMEQVDLILDCTVQRFFERMCIFLTAYILVCVLSCV